MSIRLNYRIGVAVSSSSADLKDLGNVTFDVTSDTPSEGGVWKTRVAAAATVTLPLDSITAATFLMLRIVASDPTETLTPVAITLNGTATLELAPVGSSKESNFLISSSGLSSLSVANTDDDAVSIDVTIGTAGD